MSNASPVAVRDWQPDRRTTLSLTLVLALCALFGFVLLLRQPPVLPDRHPDAVSILLQPAVTMHPSSRSPKPVPRQERLLQDAKLIRPLSLPIPLPEQQPQTLDLSVPAHVWQQPVFMEPEAKAIDLDLQHLLDAPRKPSPDLQNGGTYRNNADETVTRSGGQCVRLHTTQMSPSPTNRATIGFLTDCPGEYQPTLGEELLNWADKKQAKEAPKPPRRINCVARYLY
ncbi:MAG TPA: hypothetical protein VFK12_00810 [Gammaproteobacteria bacterium]|nr:hypothetical protein [Gammaproteobacteria bacterium]